MSNETESRGKIIDALLVRAETVDWPDIRLGELARNAGVSLAQLSRLFPSRTALMRGYMRRLDDVVLTRAAAEISANDSERERLFDVIMMRLEAMQPHRAAIRRIVKTAGAHPALIRSLVRSQRWMLEAAGVASDGARGGVRTLAITSLYGDIFRTWLSDDDAGLAKTMARLDRRLRRGERLLGDVDRIKSGVRGVFCRLRKGRKRNDYEPEDGTNSEKAGPDASSDGENSVPGSNGDNAPAPTDSPPA